MFVAISSRRRTVSIMESRGVNFCPVDKELISCLNENLENPFQNDIAPREVRLNI